jgi:hypothetical protein
MLQHKAIGFTFVLSYFVVFIKVNTVSVFLFSLHYLCANTVKQTRPLYTIKSIKSFQFIAL